MSREISPIFREGKYIGYGSILPNGSVKMLNGDIHTLDLVHKPSARYNESKMNIVKERPPEWIMTGCLDQFRVNVEHTFWTYGDTLYNPGGHEVPDHIIAHEEQHVLQQAAIEGGKDAWWREYLTNPRFRLEQEAEAYGAQYRFVCEHIKDRNKRNVYLVEFTAQLSGPLYQLAVTKTQARALILVLSGQKKLEQVA